MNNSELEDRLISFSVLVLDLSGKLSKTYAGEHLAKQVIRSVTSSALNYGEARGGESRRDFTHKIRIVLKELRETFTTLKIVGQARLCNSDDQLQQAIIENNELISIFVASTKTLQSKSQISKYKIDRKSNIAHHTSLIYS